MPRLSQLQKTQETIELAVDFDGGEPVHLTVYPNRVTLGALRRSQEAAATNDLQKSAAIFFEFIAAWDIEDDKGKPLPFTSETADLFTMDTFNALTKAVVDAILPNRTTSNA